MKTLPIGKGMPALGLGTWKSAKGEVGAAVKTAIEFGYRHIDCAKIYGNEDEIGDALVECLEKGIVTREELWITSKLWNDSHAPDAAVTADAEKTLADLRLDYLDLYLIHWPVPLRPGASMPLGADDFVPLEEISIEATRRALEALVDAGKIRHLGVSNFSQGRVTRLTEAARVQPVTNQVECHPYLQQKKLFDACREKNVFLTAYSPLGSRDRPATMKAANEPNLMEDPVIQDIARARGVTPAQILLAWSIARGHTVIPKSTHPERLAQNLKAAEIELDAGEMERIAALDRNGRFITGRFWCGSESPHTLDSLWNG
ncbi:MAG: aldo/keto reductase [Acidobacteriota bacterium]